MIETMTNQNQSDSAAFSKSKHSFLFRYFEYVLSVFRIVYDKIENMPNIENPESKVIKPYSFSLENVFREATSISRVNLIGWDLRESLEGVSQEGLCEVARKTREDYENHKGGFARLLDENYSEFVFNTVILALQFLSDTSYPTSVKYNKDKIIKILIYFHLGRVATGDFSPAVGPSENKKLDEEAYRKTCFFLFAAVLNGAKDLKEVFESLDCLYQSRLNYVADIDIDARISRDLLIIQMEYRYNQIIKEKALLKKKKSFIMKNTSKTKS